ncbi:putative nuclease HARBI1 [Prorops nasuta]|uniref:putative nuclease HARBI1 n=2 Tax=Prorops nasuta TaxID=863751 RepID=UPI0034CFCE6C
MDFEMAFCCINDQEDVDEQLIIRRRSKKIRLRMNWYAIYDDIDFQSRFRLRKEHFELLLNTIGCSLICRRQWNDAISPTTQLLIALRFYATGSFLIIIGDFSGVSKNSATKIVHRVSNAIAKLSKEFIKFPMQQDDIIQTQARNFKQAGFIRVLGAIDCIHIRIQSYGGENAELFRNRKGFFSLNVQAIVNSKLQFMDIVARWPGSSHDATIFNNSVIKARFESGEFGNGLLLGDSGYPNMPYLMTPLTNPNTPAEILYNEAQIRTRTMVERAFGIWTRMFPALSKGTRFKTANKTMDIIMACAVLYNIIRMDIEDNVDIAAYNNLLVNYNEDFHQDERKFLIENYFEACL